MKRILGICMVALMLCGCAKDAGIDNALGLRKELLESNGCSFQTAITADYGDKTFSFQLDCEMDEKGNVFFRVLKPESIADITGLIDGQQGKLTFDDILLALPLLSDEQISPVSAPWILMKTLRSGYISTCTQEEELWKLAIDDSYESDALRLDIWLDKNNVPLRGEILYDGRRIVTMDIENFSIR